LGIHPGKILIRGAKQPLKLRGSRTPRCGIASNELGIIVDGAALISGGVFREAEPSRRVENLAAVRDAVEINAKGRVVMPGFIDCHTHLAFPPPDAAEHREAATRALTADTGSPLARISRRHGPARRDNGRDQDPRRTERRRGEENAARALYPTG
jgi:imidazolonepropionase